MLQYLTTFPVSTAAQHRRSLPPDAWHTSHCRASSLAVACSGCSGSATASEGDGSEGGTLSAELSSVTAAGDDGSEGDTLLAVPSSVTSPEGGGMSLRVSRRGSARSAAASSARSVASSGGGWPSVRSSSARSAAVWCSLVEGPTTPYIHNATANATMASRVLTMFCALSKLSTTSARVMLFEPVKNGGPQKTIKQTKSGFN